MNERVMQLRQQSVDAHPTLSAERAQLVTKFYRSGEVARHSVPVSRALAFQYILEHKTICIQPG